MSFLYAKTSITFCTASAKLINFFSRVIKRERRAGRRRHVKELHHRLCTMMAGTDGDALLVEDRADVVRVNVLDRKRQNARFFAAVPMICDARDIGQTLGRIFEQVVFVRRGGFKIDRIYIIDRRSKPDAGGDRRRSGLELVRVSAQRSFFQN